MEEDVLSQFVQELVMLGNGRPGTKISAGTLEEIKKNLDNLFSLEYERRNGQDNNLLYPT